MIPSLRRRVVLGLAVLLAGCGTSSMEPSSARSTSDPSSGNATGPGTGIGGDWPMYGHDLQRTGYNADERALGAADVGRLAARWEGEIGIGAYPTSSGPVVAGGRVFVASSVRKGDNFFAFDASSGRRLWSASVGHGRDFEVNVGVGSTAAVSGSVVCIGGGDAAYYAFDAATGAALWRSPMDAGPSAFAWSSPLPRGDRMYVGVASAADNPPVRGDLRALALADGGIVAQRFFVPRGVAGATVWNSAAATADGAAVVVATGEDDDGYDGPYNRAVVALEADGLEILGAHKESETGQDLDFATTPVVFRDGQGRNLVGANHKNGVFYAYDLANLDAGAVWQRATGVNIGMMPAYDPSRGAGGTLFVVGDNGQLFALDPATGADRWPPLAVGYAFGNMALANGLVFIGAGGGNVAVLDASRGTLLRTLTPAHPGRTFSGVAVAGGRVYWLSGGWLNVWGIS